MEGEARKPHRVLKNILLLIVILLLCLAGWRIADNFLNKEEVAEEEVINVYAREAAVGDISTSSIHTGKVASTDEINVLPLVAGKVVDVAVKAGQKVKAGDKLFTVDGSQIETQVNTAKIQLDAADEARKNGKEGVQDLKNAIVDVDDVIAQLKTALGKLPKSVPAAATAAAIELEAQRTQLTGQLSQAQAAKKDLQTQMKQAESGVKQLETQYKLAKEGYDAAKKAISNTVVTAPSDGVITALNVKPDTVVSQAMPAVTMSNTTDVHIEISVSEKLINQIKVGDEVGIYIKAVSEAAFVGRITTIVTAPPTGMTTYPVTVVIDNKEGRILPGMSAEIEIVDQAATNAVLIPSDAVIVKSDGETVALVRDGKPVFTQVQTGIDDGENVEILSGVSAGDMVVYKGQSFITEDTKIQVVEESAG